MGGNQVMSNVEMGQTDENAQHSFEHKIFCYYYTSILFVHISTLHYYYVNKILLNFVKQTSTFKGEVQAQLGTNGNQLHQLHQQMTTFKSITAH